MNIILRDLQILRTGTRLIRLLYLLKAALTVGIIVFTALEVGSAVRTKQLKPN